MSLLEQFYAGDVRALARLVSHIENGGANAHQLLAEFYARAGTALRIGITGPPGSGKSTIVNLLAQMFVADGRKVGIVAVDPSSPFTGGALLGDRVRMNELPLDGRVYFRSMATRGATGGLAAATDNVTVVYDAFGFDITLIETVGVGQIELDIVDTCDSVVVVVVPESGDAVQTMKAGLMEIADVFCVNKSDRPGAERMGAELRMALETRRKIAGAWAVPVLHTEASNKKNVDQLKMRIEQHVSYIRSSGEFEKHRRRQVGHKIAGLLRYRFQQEFLDRMTEQADFDQLVDDIMAGRANPYAAADDLYARFRQDALALDPLTNR